MLIDELLTYLFDGQAHPLAMQMATWLESSRRFTTFITSCRDKIRKKLRTVQHEERLLDLRLELETAYLLLQERSLSLEYEPQYGKVRGPDFAVTFTTSLTFMVEVTRLRPAQDSTLQNDQTYSLVGERVADTMCSKFRQLLSQRANVLIISIDNPIPTQSDLHATMLRVKQRAERNDSTLSQRYRFRDRADFFRHYQRLSEILVRGSQLHTDQPVIAWINPQAKHPLPSKVRTALYRSHTV